MSTFAFGSAVSIAAIAATEETTFDPDSVTPGAVGFIMTAVFAAAVILLGVNLVRRLRRNTYRAEIREQLEAEAAANAGSAESGSAEPGTAESGTAESGSAEPGSAEPGTAGPGSAAPGDAGPAADERGRDA